MSYKKQATLGVNDKGYEYTCSVQPAWLYADSIFASPYFENIDALYKVYEILLRDSGRAHDHYQRDYQEATQDIMKELDVSEREAIVLIENLATALLVLPIGMKGNQRVLIPEIKEEDISVHPYVPKFYELQRAYDKENWIDEE